MPSFDQILNILIPIILVLIVLGWVYWKFGDHLAALWEWVKGLMGHGVDKAKEKVQYTKEIVYE